VVALLSSVLMNGAEVYASRMMMLLAPVSASALSRCSSLLTMRLVTHYQLSGWISGEIFFASLVLVVLTGSEEVNKYSSSSSLLLVILNLVDRSNSILIVTLLVLPFKCINFFENEKEGQRLLSRSSIGFKESHFLLLKFGDFSAISRVLVVLVTIETPHVGPLRILRRFVYTIGNRNSFLLSTGTVVGS
jgi:hypothetical protein